MLGSARILGVQRGTLSDRVFPVLSCLIFKSSFAPRLPLGQQPFRSGSSFYPIARHSSRVGVILSLP